MHVNVATYFEGQANELMKYVQSDFTSHNFMKFNGQRDIHSHL